MSTADVLPVIVIYFGNKEPLLSIVRYVKAIPPGGNRLSQEGTQVSDECISTGLESAQICLGMGLVGGSSM